jgi:hypothetical protein
MLRGIPCLKLAKSRHIHNWALWRDITGFLNQFVDIFHRQKSVETSHRLRSAVYEHRLWKSPSCFQILFAATLNDVRSSNFILFLYFLFSISLIFIKEWSSAFLKNSCTQAFYVQFIHLSLVLYTTCNLKQIRELRAIFWQELQVLIALLSFPLKKDGQFTKSSR